MKKIAEQIRQKAAEYRDYTAENLSKLVKVKSYSSQEEDVCRLIVTLCEAGLTRSASTGSLSRRPHRQWPQRLAIDGHIDTVE